MKTLRLLPLLCSGFLVSCLNYTEELWIHANGSGKVHATIAINSELAGQATSGRATADEVEDELEKMLAETRGAKVESYQSFVQGNERVWDFVIHFDDLKNLKPVLDKASGTMGSVFGNFEIEKKSGLTTITRTVDLSETRVTRASDATGNALAKTLGSLLASAMFSGYSLEYTVHFPSQILTANSLQIGTDKRSVRWRFPLAQAAKEPVEMTADIQPVSPLPKIIAIAGAVLLLILVVLKALPRKRKEGENQAHCTRNDGGEANQIQAAE